MKMRNRPRNWIPVIVVVLLFAGIFWQMYQYRVNALRNAASFKDSIENIEQAEAFQNEFYDDEMLERIANYGKLDGSVLDYHGKQYKRNSAVHAILLLGIDKEGPMEVLNVSGAAGQSDAIYLVAQDVARDTVKLLAIPRDTITLIRLYDIMGNEIGIAPQHLNLQFAYGDGGDRSIYLAKEAVSNLLFGLKINGVMAINRSVISIMNDDLGGVPMTIDIEGLEEIDPSFKKGETVTLDGEQAQRYVRFRGFDGEDTAVRRMDLQKHYIESFDKQLRSQAAKDGDLIPTMMNDLQDYMLTDMPKDQYMDMAIAFLNSKDRITANDIVTAPGQAKLGDWFEEYYVDEDALEGIIIDFFYREM